MCTVNQAVIETQVADMVCIASYVRKGNDDWGACYCENSEIPFKKYSYLDKESNIN